MLANNKIESNCKNTFMVDQNDGQTDDELPPISNKLICKSQVFRLSIVISAVLLSALMISCVALYENSMHLREIDVLSQWNVKHLPTVQQLWHTKAKAELKLALERPRNEAKPRNVILFVGDGMGPNTVTAARIYGVGEEGFLTWEQFPNMGLLKTYCADKMVPDSFSTATALFSGIKANFETGGVDSTVNLTDCIAAQNASHQVSSIVKWAQDAGMLTGFVTNTRVTHATPAALYAHCPNRRWECEQAMPITATQAGCKDIARQLIEDEVGRKINVIMGGGRQGLVSNVNDSAHDAIDHWGCISKDGRNLIEQWKSSKMAAGESFAVVENSGQLAALQTNATDYVLGIFANGHMQYDYERDTTDKGMPSLEHMTVTAVKVLSDKNKGFLLVVESGLIDQAHHRGTAKRAISEVLALNDAINATLHALGENLEDTMIIVTADHSHTLTINGYPQRGANILGMADVSKTENIPYTILTYGTTYAGFQVNSKGQRKDPATDDTNDWLYTQQGAINTNENYHGGSDVTIHATGPMSHLFHGVHEQSYVAHAIAYALRIGHLSESLSDSNKH